MPSFVAVGRAGLHEGVGGRRARRGRVRLHEERGAHADARAHARAVAARGRAADAERRRSLFDLRRLRVGRGFCRVDREAQAELT